MSASTEKKNRTAARADGTDKKTVAARKEAEKKRKDTIKWSIVGGIIFLFIVAIIILNTGMFYRNTTAYSVDIDECQVDGVTVAADTADFSIAELNYMYRFNYIQFVNQYGSMASYLGLDTSKPLKSQACTMSGQEGYTWFDYFMDSAKSQLQSFAVMRAYAEAAGIEITDDDRAEIEEAVENLKSAADENGYPSANNFLSTNYGKGSNLDLFRSVMELQAIASAVQDSIMDAKDFSAAEIKAHYAEIKDDYDNFSYAYYLVSAETETGEDGQPAAPTAEAMAAAKETAQQIMDAVKDGDLESAVIEVCGEEVVPVHDDELEGEAEEGHVHTASTTQTDVQGQSVVSALSEWLKSENRQAGEMEVIESADTGYYVVIFNDRHTVTEPTEESDGVAYCDYISEKLLREAELQTWSDNVYSKITEGVTANDKFGERYVN